MTPEQNVKIVDILSEVAKELGSALRKHDRPMSSHHEAYAVILEELDEYKEWVWMKASKRDEKKMRAELVQVAAMAVRAILELTSPTTERRYDN